MTEKEKQEMTVSLAEEILSLARSTLQMYLRYLDKALSRLEPVPIESHTILTDGRYILFNGRHVLDCYKHAKEIPVRDYLHIVLHCIFSHMYMAERMDRVYWDLACDVAVENIITELGLKAVATFRDSQQEQFITAMRSEVKHMTAESVYSCLRTKNLTGSQVAQLRGLFLADDHEIWYMTRDQIAAVYGVNLPEQSEGERNRWQEISHRIQVDMETSGKQRGSQAGSLLQNLTAVNRERYDYTAFLKKFAVMGEAMKVNDEEFDNIFYTYGLQMYGKMPLVEPLEYKEVRRIREFVIAIDTSGSTSGELVQSFVQKTYNILKSTESFFSKINLHIIQCDTEVQEDVKITCQEDFDLYLKDMAVRGHGGTDFRPVFSRVEELRKNGEFTNLRGLIYFTDGWGVFPAVKPDYDTAFVFVEDEENQTSVPPWAIRLVLPREDILE